MFDRYVENARRTIFFARYEAAQLGSSEIAPEHILLGLLKDLPLHNTTLPKDVVNNFVQVLDNLIVCGIPGGGADPSSAAATCGSAG